MKKLIAISIVLTLAVSAAFAEVTVGGNINAGATVISGSSAENSELGAKGAHSGRLEGTYANDEGSFGAHVKISAADGWWAQPFAYVWWKPISLIRVFGGVNPFGEFGINYIVGWGWHASDAEDYVAFGDSGMFTRAAWSYGGWGDKGFALTLTPFDGLAINVAVPYETKEGKAAEVYNHMVGQLVYDITDIGQIGVTYTSGGGYRETYTKSEDPGAVHAQFYLTAIQNLQLNIGAKYTLAGDITKDPDTPQAEKTTYTPPITLGFGLNYNVSDTFGVKARLAAGFNGSKKVEDADAIYSADYYNLKLGFDVMPYFDLSILKLFLNLGIEFNDKTYDTSEPGKGVEKQDGTDSVSAFGWYVNPYITKSVGGGTFYAGFRLYSDGIKYKGTVIDVKDGKTTINWGVPIGIQVGF
jgi:hypothetical protein